MSLLPPIAEALGHVQLIADKQCRIGKHARMWFSIQTIPGSNTVSVFRSVYLKTDRHKWLQPLWDFIGDREAMIVDREVIEDDAWMHSWVEHTVYEFFERRNAS